MIIDAEQTGRDELVISYFDPKGMRRVKRYNPESGDSFKGWVLCKEKDPQRSRKFKNWDGKPVKQVRKKRLSKFEVYEFLERLPQEDREEMLSTQKPDLCSIDIETEIVDGFPDPNVAKEAVTTIAVVVRRQALVLSTSPLEGEDVGYVRRQIHEHVKNLVDVGFDFKHVQFDTEYEMLLFLMKKVVPKAGLQTGWNYIDFDWDYLVNRCKRFGFEVSSLSPTKNFVYKTNIPRHLAIKDYMKVFKGWDKTVDVTENYTLDYIAEKVLGKKKVAHEGSLQELYENNFRDYVFYNVIDAILVLLIHERLRTIDAIFSVSNLCNVPLYKSEQPVALTEALMFKEFFKEGRVIADRKEDAEKDKKYEGAFVKKPEPGAYRAVMMCDFSSLYPTVMRQFNISPEVFVEKVDSDQMKRKRIEEGYIVTYNGCVFKNQDSALYRVLTGQFNQRKSEQKESQRLEKESHLIRKELERRGEKET